ncbi:MAG: ATPase domain-containing protein [Candidatus Micrarchaeota archaeon]
MAKTELGVDEKLPILRKNRVQTGIEDLDIILEGGYQHPGNIMIVGPTGMEKNAFAYHFAAAAKPRKENVYIICGDAAPESVIKKAAGAGIELKADNIFFIDCYSSTLGSKKEVKSGDGVRVIAGPSALNDLSLELNEAIKNSDGKKIRIVFDTLSTFVLYNPQDSIRKFLAVIEGRLKDANATAVYLVEEGVHDKQLLSLLEHGMDEIFVIEEKAGKCEIRLPMTDSTVPFKLGPSGISIV